MSEPTNSDQKQITTEQAQKVRALEALCGTDFPTQIEIQVREALAVDLARRWGLRHSAGMMATANRQVVPPSTRKAG